MNGKSNEEQWEQIRPMINMQAILARSLAYLWKRSLDFYAKPAPEEWHTYSVLQIIEWCRADAKAQREVEFPTQGKGDDNE